jgi:hypothetical protein
MSCTLQNGWQPSASEDTFQAFLDRYIYNTRDFEEYLELACGEERMAELRRAEPLKRSQPAHGNGSEGDAAMTGQNAPYSLLELMVCAASHLLEDNKTAVIGTGPPLAAAMLAQKTHAPTW